MNEQLEDFPKRDELKSVFVEREIEDEEVGVQDDGFRYTCNEFYKLETPVTEEQCKDLMKSTDFGYPGGPDRAANLELPVTSYSGGWKLKVQLCAAQLMNCDVLMHDEPTGHLDVDNIKWLEDRKLRTFKGVKGNTLTMFVEKYPEKKAYFELSNETMKFAFPEPGFLEGVKSRSKVVLRMTSVNFQYPTKDKPTIVDVNLTVSQVSRVAVIGANGAGKSAVNKGLVGEQLPTSGFSGRPQVLGPSSWMTT